MNSKAYGYAGELDAREYLEENGYSIVDSNKKIAGVEIDIICKIGDLIVFCEVKSREKDLFGSGIEGIRPNQIRRYKMAGEFFMAKRENENKSLRFDVIEINHGKINHIIDAFR